MRFEDTVTVRYIRFADEQAGWAALGASASDGSEVSLVGPLAHLEVGERAEVHGEWVEDSRYGPQVKVEQARPLPPSDPAALAAYLRRVRHVGAKRAADLVARFGADQVLDEIDRDPERAFAAVGIRGPRAVEAAESWQSFRVTRRLHLLLAPHGLSYLSGRIHEHYGPGAYEVVADDPYQLTSLFGVGFAIADRIAGGVEADGPPGRRRQAAILHALGEAERSGSTCTPQPALLEQASELLTGDSEAEEGAQEALLALERAGQVVKDEEWVYRTAMAELEAELAERVAGLLARAPSTRLEGGSVDGGELTGEQQTALHAAFEHRLSLITGGPGTGKTASIRTIAAHARRRGATVMLVAPTGRAAVRMTEAASVKAQTVHSALGWIPDRGPTRDEDDPLECDLLIVDETSMANLRLLVTLLRAVGDRTHVVLVGDADQLAPVGAGKPFAELIESETVPVTRLTHIFRQAADSMIVQAAHAIRRGEMPELRAAEGMRRDLFMIERAAPSAAIAEIVSLVSERLPSHYGVDPVRDIQVFAPVYKGELGIDALNRALRDALNPDGQPVRGGRLRLGDKLMMTGRNLHDLGLMNGTLLRLLDEVPAADRDADEAALVLASEESVFRLAPEDGDRLALAYACSVHRGQGIELPIAVIVAHPAAGAFFLRREMLYTAVTRARLATVIVGSRDVVARAARTPDTGRRHGRLANRLIALTAPDDALQATNDQVANATV